MGSSSDGLFIVWAPYSARARDLGDVLAAQLCWIHNLRFRRPLCAPLKYPVQGIRTFRRLWRDQPKIVFVQTPPVFAALCVWLFARLTHTPYVIDSHSGAFESRKWKWSLPLHKLLSRQAVVTLVTNDALRDVVDTWGAQVMVVHDPPIRFPVAGPTCTGQRFQLLVPCGFGTDEMISDILSAAGLMPDVHFVFTGDAHGAGREYLSDHPQNVTFTGWLSDTEYARRISLADAVLTLTTQERTLLRGAWEAMYAARPLITSSRASLRQYFTKGTLFVDDSVDAIVSAIRQLQTLHSILRCEMVTLRREKADESNRQLKDLLELCEQCTHACAPNGSSDSV